MAGGADGTPSARRGTMGAMPKPVTVRTPDTPALPDRLEPLDAADGPLEDEARIEAVTLTGEAPTGTDARVITLAESRVTATLTGAKLRDAHVRDCAFDTADLANVDLRGAALHRVTVQDARLTGASLPETSLRDVTFTGCRLDLVSLADARVERVAFVDCDLRETAFDGAQLRDVRFERCDLAGASFSRVQLARTVILGCDLTRVRALADLRGAAMRWPDVVDNAAAFASALGFTVLGDDD